MHNRFQNPGFGDTPAEDQPNGMILPFDRHTKSTVPLDTEDEDQLAMLMAIRG